MVDEVNELQREKGLLHEEVMRLRAQVFSMQRVIAAAREVSLFDAFLLSHNARVVARFTELREALKDFPRPKKELVR